MWWGVFFKPGKPSTFFRWFSLCRKSFPKSIQNRIFNGESEHKVLFACSMFFPFKKQASLPQLSSGKLNLVEKRGQFGKVPKSYSYRCVSRVRFAEESPSIEFYHFTVQNVQNVDTRINFKRGSSEFRWVYYGSSLLAISSTLRGEFASPLGFKFSILGSIPLETQVADFWFAMTR